MKDKLKELYNLKKNLEIKLNNYNKMEYLKEGKKWHEKMYRLVTETREELNRLNKKIEFIENLKVEIKKMKCFIKRNNMYYKHYLGLDSCKIHWVMDKQEAKLFSSVAEARQTIKVYKIKNVEVIKI